VFFFLEARSRQGVTSSSMKLRLDSIFQSTPQEVSQKFGQSIFEDTDDIDVYDNDDCKTL
jgi:hypothetical protein